MINEEAFMEEMTVRLHKYEEALGAKELPLDKPLPECTICRSVIDATTVCTVSTCPIYFSCHNNLRTTSQSYIGYTNIWWGADTLRDKKAIIRLHYKKLISDLKKAGYTYE